jgi:protein-disulfide isomerase
MKFFAKACMLALGFGLVCGVASAKSESAYKVYGKTVSVDQVAKDNKSEFYEIDKKKFELISQAARQAYLDTFFDKLAKKEKTSVEAARKNYFEKNVKISEKEVTETLNKFKDHPQLSKLPKAEQVKQIREYLSSRDQRVVVENIVAAGLAKGELQIIFKAPVEPKFNVVINNEDWVRYGPNPGDIKPMGCKNDCPITVVEYSEFECPFCSRVIPDIKRLLKEYKGKIRWVVRDFPLSFHQRAKPAAIAAICAGEQGKYWHMYGKLFENQTKLGDADFVKYAKAIGVYNSKYKKCVANPAPALAKIDKNMASGVKHGVTGTPAFFINGRRLAGALPYSQFKQVIDSELSAK